MQVTVSEFITTILGQATDDLPNCRGKFHDRASMDSGMEMCLYSELSPIIHFLFTYSLTVRLQTKRIAVNK